MPLAENVAAHEVREAEEAYRGALLRADAAWLEAHLTPDAMYVHQSGGIDRDGARTYIERLRTGVSVYHSIEHEDTLVRMYGDTAIVTGLSKVTMSLKGTRSDLEHRYTRVWLKRNGQWYLATNQSGGTGHRL